MPKIAFVVDGKARIAQSDLTVSDIPDAVADEILTAQAEVLVRAQRENALKSLNVAGRSRGITAAGIRKSAPYAATSGTGRSVKIYFSGMRYKGKTRVGEVAFLNEFGVRKRHMAARNFIRLANESSVDELDAIAKRILDAHA